MAGLGFALRKLLHRDDLGGAAAGCLRCAMVSSGPWLLTVLCLAGLGALRAHSVSRDELTVFQIIVYYNFSFSLVVSGPVLAIATRHLSDLVFTRRTDEAMGLLLGSLLLLLGSQVLIVVPFYFGFAELATPIRVLACVNFLLVSAIWLAHVFLVTLHNDRSVTATFAAGLGVALAAALALGRFHATAGLLAGFDLGLALILYALLARIVADYPRRDTGRWAFLACFRRHWRLAAGGLVYNAAIWVDKWLMWTAPEAVQQPCRLVSCLHYDSAMFLAYLTIVPSIALFVLSVETDFYEVYLRYLRDIREHAPWSAIAVNTRRIGEVLLAGAGRILLWQGLVSSLAILLAPRLLDLLGIAFVELGIFRLGVLGAFFHALFMFLLIVLSYFELHRETLALQLLFLASNAALTLWSLGQGVAWYGAGYALASVLSFAAAGLVTFRLLPNVPYETFVRRNAALQR
ncbi:MAG: hypothetical protein FJ221_16690 [Lentisphaerae bacterium]|nr:hypothetical protein [Lentisphaerota bacterium]